MMKTKNNQWVLCPLCHNKTRTKLRADTELKNFPLFCPKCKNETLVNVKQLNISIINEPDAKLWRLAMKKYNLLDFEIIEKATQGGCLAMQKVVNHYIRYIMYFARWSETVNYDDVEEIKAQLMKAVLEFRLDK